jgi:RNA-binding protein YhbY
MDFDPYSQLKNAKQPAPLQQPLQSGEINPLSERTKLDVRALFCEKSMIRVGAKGVQASHIKSLTELIAYHGVVKVKISDHRCDAQQVISELSEGNNVRLLSIHWTGRYLLFEQKDRKSPPPKMKKYDTRVEKTCWECGQVGHVAYDCMNKIREVKGSSGTQASVQVN